MNKKIVQVKTCLISVSHKEHIVEFAQKLSKQGVHLIGTGETALTLKKAVIPVEEVSSYTGFPEIMEGRVKTLHPKILGGILGLRNRDQKAAEQHGIQWIDMVICNLYPFGETVANSTATRNQAIEHIDIGGPTLIRSAAKNMDWVAVIVDPLDYADTLKELENQGGITYETRSKLAAKAFAYTASYDALISQYFINHTSPPDTFPETLNLTFKKAYDLRYGENPHQKAALYKKPYNNLPNLVQARLHQGKQLSYNNIADAHAALDILQEFTKPSCVIIKHANPCGAAASNDITAAFQGAYEADSVSAFGGVIALNRACTKEIAHEITTRFTEIVLAPAYESEALRLFQKKENVRVLELGENYFAHRMDYDMASCDGGLLVQEHDIKTVEQKELTPVTQKKPTAEEIEALLFAWKVVKHAKSNAVVIAQKDAETLVTLSIGAGQVSRVDAVEIALKKAGGNARGAVLASDAFFPFRDGIDALAGSGISAIIQPGGSMRDKEIIDACNEYGIAMVFTNVRGFKH